MDFYNDAFRLPQYVAMAILYFFVLIIAVVIHELGHIIYLRLILKKKLKYTWIKNSIVGLEIEPVDGMDDKQHITALVVGLVIGMVPIFVASFVFGPAILLIAPYLYIMKYDVSQVIKRIKFDDDERT